MCWHLAALESSSTVSVATLQHGLTSVPSHLHALCSTCFLCAVSWGLSGRVWLRTWCCLEVRVRLNCLCGACSNCITLGGLLSSVLVVTFCSVSGASVATSFLLALSFLFVPSGWPAVLHSVGERVALYGFQILFARWCVCWWMSMMDGLTRSVFFHGRVFWRDFLLCVLVIGY